MSVFKTTKASATSHSDQQIQNSHTSLEQKQHSSRRKIWANILEKSKKMPKKLEISQTIKFERIRRGLKSPLCLRFQSTDEIHAGHQNMIQKKHFYCNSVSSKAPKSPRNVIAGARLCAVAASEPRQSFTEMTVSCLSVRRPSAAPLHGTVRKPRVPKGDPASVELHLEVGAKVSDLGISHRQIGVPHTGRILQRAEVKTQISI